MSVMTQAQSPISPGVGARRKVPKIPRLPLSAFTPPNSGTSDKFPLPPSPTALRPTRVLDADAAAGRDGVHRVAASEIASAPRALALSVEVDLASGAELPTTSPAAGVGLAIRTPFTRFTPQLADGVAAALARGHTVEIDVRADLAADENGWEALNELLSAALAADRPASSGKPGSIVLVGVLPAPHDLSITLVKLLTHPVYRTFQNYTASISLFPSVAVQFAPPAWGGAVPTDDKERREWKRRIKMYLGHAVEAFGYQRIVYASGGASDGPWFELARESLAELGVEQDAVDAVFAGNAESIYGASSA